MCEGVSGLVDVQVVYTIDIIYHIKVKMAVSVHWGYFLWASCNKNLLFGLYLGAPDMLRNSRSAGKDPKSILWYLP